MIDWVDCLGRNWGAYMRRDPLCISASLWTRNVDLMRSGITSNGTFWNGRPYKYPCHQIPIRGMSRDQLVFHRAWKNSLTGNLQELTWTHYVPHAKLKRKAEVLRISSDSYFKGIDEAHEKIEWAIVSGDL